MNIPRRVASNKKVYFIGTHCFNCGFAGRKKIPMGVKVLTAMPTMEKCRYCGVVAVRPRTQD